jgi:hypothetical protein
MRGAAPPAAAGRPWWPVRLRAGILVLPQVYVDGAELAAAAVFA